MRIALAICVLLVLAGCSQSTDPAERSTVTDYATSESVYEWYVESYNPATWDTLECRYYKPDGSLKEYMAFQYDAGGHNTGVLIYSSDTVKDSSTLIGEFSYVYDGAGNCSSGILKKKINGVMTTESTFTATYNTQGNYLDCLVLNGSGGVIEHRVCSYDSSGTNYLVETYYSDTGTSDMIERYECVYDPVKTSKWIREDHYIKLASDDPADAYPSYTNYVAHTFTWNGNDMYLQTDFLSDAAKNVGAMISAIMYTFDNGYAKTRSCFNQNGKLMSYRSYEYDAAWNRTQLFYYNYSNSAGTELEARKTNKYYLQDGASMQEQKTYTYSYASRSLASAGSRPAPGALESPGSAHHSGD
jgi:hypothetical protein